MLRRVTPEDAAAIVAIHSRAVHSSAASSYSREILDEWSPVIVSHERVERLRNGLQSSEEMAIIAVGAGGAVVGFGSICPEANELRAVYVDPEFGRQGIGRRLLEAVEIIARDADITELKMDASLNAEAFYLANGYQTVSCGEHVLNSGRRMACIHMSKNLSSLRA